MVGLVQQCLEQQGGTDNVVLIAGPAFNAGRYGMACGAVCQAVEQQLQLPCVTALFPDNPAVESYRRDVMIVQAADSVLGMQQAITRLASVARKRIGGQLITPTDDQTIPKGIRQNYFAESSGAVRAVTVEIRIRNRFVRITKKNAHILKSKSLAAAHLFSHCLHDFIGRCQRIALGYAQHFLGSSIVGFK